MAEDTHEAVGQQELVFMDAVAIYRDRHELRGDAWEDFPPDDTLHHIESKLARCKSIVQNLRRQDLTEERRERLIKAIEDDGLDLINYAGFLVRRYTGRV